MDGLSMLLILLAALVGGMVVGLVLVFRSRRPAADPEAAARLEAQTHELAGRLTQLAEESRRAEREITTVMQDRFDKMSERMGRSLEDTATKTAKSMGEIQTRLHVIDEAQKNITALSGEVVSLQNILSNKQARGAFGEVQLKDLVRSVLPPNAYELQATLSNNRRPDMLVLLPNPPGPIAVDAKFPLESYQALCASNGDDACRRSFAKDIKKHVADIANKYILPGETAESAIMFLPSEAVYAELHANCRDVVEFSFKKRVWIVSPTTLMATLNTVRAVLMDVQMREQAGLIQKEVGQLMKDVIRLDERVGKLIQHHGSVTKDLSLIQTSTGKISRRAQKIHEVRLEDDDEEITQLEPVAAPRLEGSRED